jgi:hypothetical protein
MQILGASSGNSGLRYARRNFEELLQNFYEAIEGCLLVDVSAISIGATDKLLETAV